MKGITLQQGDRICIKVNCKHVVLLNGIGGMNGGGIIMGGQVGGVVVAAAAGAPVLAVLPGTQTDQVLNQKEESKNMHLAWEKLYSSQFV